MPVYISYIYMIAHKVFILRYNLCKKKKILGYTSDSPKKLYIPSFKLFQWHSLINNVLHLWDANRKSISIDEIKIMYVS